MKQKFKYISDLLTAQNMKEIEENMLNLKHNLN